ncbi:ABC transporter permease [Clostridiaceae bacterium M8S5]|nr:ABC transporter permease [Clostridiaceae bacterium M8S5]
MYNLIKADLYKLRKTKAMKIMFGITTLSAVLMAWCAYLMPQGKIDQSLSGVVFMFSDINIMSIIGGIIASIIICSDFDNKTIHSAIASGSSRVYIIISKALVFCIAIIIMLMPYMITTGIALSTGAEFSVGPVAVGFLYNLVSEAIGADMFKWLMVSFTLIIVYIAQLSICIPLAFTVKKPVLVIGIYYGLSIFCGQLGKLGENNAIVYRILSFTPFGGGYTFLTTNVESIKLIKALSASVLFVTIMSVIAINIFKKSEIK